MIDIILTLQWGHDYQRTEDVSFADHSDHSDHSEHSFDSLRSDPAHTWICLGWIWMLKIFANYLRIAMPGPAQMQLVTQLQGREKLWTELNCVKSVSLPDDLLARQDSHLSFDRLLLPISIAGNWHHQPPWDVAMSEIVVHFIFFFSKAWLMSVWLSTSSNNYLWEVTK